MWRSFKVSIIINSGLYFHKTKDFTLWRNYSPRFMYNCEITETATGWGNIHTNKSFLIEIYSCTNNYKLDDTLN